MGSSVRLILYSKPGCHLCEGLQEKLERISSLNLDLEIRDITTRQDWFQAFQYEIPVLFYVSSPSPFPTDATSGDDTTAQMEYKALDESCNHTISDAPVLIPVERSSPRASVSHVEKLVYRAIAKAK